MNKVILIESLQELKTLFEPNGTLAQLKTEDGSTRLFTRDNGEWIEVQIYND